MDVPFASASHQEEYMQVVALHISTALLLKDISESVKRLICALDHLQFGNIFPCVDFVMMAVDSGRRTEQTSHNFHLCVNSRFTRAPPK